MKKRVFISFLALESQEGTYSLNDGNNSDQYDECFGQVPLAIKLMNEGKLDCIGLFDARQALDEQKPDSYANLLARLKELYPGIENAAQRFSLELDEPGMGLFSSIAGIIAKYSKEDEVDLYLDSTHNTPGIPMFIVLNAIEQAYANARVKGIYCWKEQPCPAIDGKRNYAVEDLVKTYNDNRLGEAIGYFQRTMHIAKENVKAEETDTEDIKNLKRILGDLETSLQYSNFVEVVKHSRELVAGIENMVNDPGVSGILKAYLKPLGNMFASYIEEDDVYTAINIAKGLYYDASQVQPCVTLLEAIYNQIIDQLIEKNLNESDKLLFCNLTANQRYKLHKYAETALCIRWNSSAEEVSREYKKLMQFTSKEAAELFESVGNALEQVYKNTNPSICYKKVYDRKFKAGRAISDFLSELRNSIDHGFGKKAENEEELMLAYIDVLKLMYRTFVLE